MKILVLIAFLTVSCFAVAQQNISGTVFDKQTGESLIGAAVIEKGTKNGTTTNQYGYFFLKPENSDSTVNLEVSFMGYKKLATTVKKSDNIALALVPELFSIQEITINKENNQNLRQTTGIFQLIPSELKHFPSFSGETDLTTFLQLVPGVALAGDGNASVNVRGGTSDQNLFLLDDMPLYYVNHLGNFLSTFNADIIKSTNFYKSGFPAQYGGRLSSVVDVRTNDGNLHKFDVYGTLGLISSKIGIEGPVIKNKSSFLISARKNTIPFFRWLYGLNLDYKFYDTNLKFNSILSPGERLFFSFYLGNDGIAVNNTAQNGEHRQSISWGNNAGSVRYSKVWSPKLYSNMVLGHTKYKYTEMSVSEQRTEGDGQNYSYEFLSAINDNFLNINFEIYSLEKLKLKTGYGITVHHFSPGETIANRPETANNSYPEFKTQEHNLYFQVLANPFYKFSVHAGIRTTLLHTREKDYLLPEPRISVLWKFSRHLDIHAAFDAMHQNFHLLTNQGTGIPVEYRIPAFSSAPPESAMMFSTGFSYAPENRDFQLNLDLYEKRMAHLLTLKEGVNFSSANRQSLKNTFWNDGKGLGKGIEITVRKNSGRTTGWLGTSVSKSERSFSMVNDGKPYPYEYDRPFEFKSFLSHRVSKKVFVSATWVFGSGAPITIAESQYYDLDGQTILIYGEKNGFRGAPYHRLDIGVSYKLFPKWGESEWNFSIINLYNRKNPYFYFADYDNGFGGSGKMTFYQQSLFPFLPSLSYSFKF